MASRGLEEREEIEKSVSKANSDCLRNEVMKNTSKTELEVTRMSRDELKACSESVRRQKKAETWKKTTKSVRGTPTGPPGREKNRIRSNMVDKELESLQVAWAGESAKARLQNREDRMEKENRNEKAGEQGRKD